MNLYNQLIFVTNLAAFNWSNPWLVGTGTAILSGLVVNFISRSLWSRKDDKELRQKIDSANHEVVYALRPSIAEGSMPTQEVIEALVKATARKYALERENLMTIEEFADELVKEVMDSSFISHQQKVNYCAAITKIKDLPKSNKLQSAEADNRLIRFGTTDPYYVYRQQMRRQLTYALTVVTAVMAMATTISILDSDLKPLIENVATIAAAAISVPVAFSILQFVKRNEAMERQKELDKIFQKYKIRSSKLNKKINKS